MDTKTPRKPLAPRNLKAAAGALVMLMALVTILALFVGNWCAAVMIPIAFVAGCMAIAFSAQADGVDMFPGKGK